VCASIKPRQTKVVCCNAYRPKTKDNLYEFDFLSFTFRRRGVRDKSGQIFTGFLPAISKKAKKLIVAKIRRWNVHRWVSGTVQLLAKLVNTIVRGWINYYGKFYKAEMNFLYEAMQNRQIKWGMRKCKGLRKRKTRTREMIDEVQRQNPVLFVHWSLR